MSKRVSSISVRLGRESAGEAKSKMLEGSITAAELARDDEELYFDEKTRGSIRKNQLLKLEENRTGFYDEMKKEINENACEECTFCHKMKAFC